MVHPDQSSSEHLLQVFEARGRQNGDKAWALGSWPPLENIRQIQEQYQPTGVKRTRIQLFGGEVKMAPTAGMTICQGQFCPNSWFRPQTLCPQAASPTWGIQGLAARGSRALQRSSSAVGGGRTGVTGGLHPPEVAQGSPEGSRAYFHSQREGAAAIAKNTAFSC